jgi:predicted DCC family thiol-disulfide oxidoreductase YuxK
MEALLKGTDGAERIVVFDGLCKFCDGWVQFISKRDRTGSFAFAAVQSKAGQLLLRDAGYPADTVESIVLVSRDYFYAGSDAVIHILAELGGVWRVALALTVIPRSARDFFYYAIARRRYLIAGRKDSCSMPLGVDARKFLG